MRCSDNHFYVVKFSNNPQHPRVLANEWLATRLAERIGLPVPITEVVEVGEWLVNHSPELNIQLAHLTVPCQAGLQFGSRYAVNPMEGQVFDYLPMNGMSRVRNLETFTGVLALDKWTGNADGRQAAFWRRLRQHKYTAIFIDQGYCFNAGEWTFPDYPLRGVYARDEVYAGVRSWKSFEPWLSRIERLEEPIIWEIAQEIPPEWYADEWDALERLVNELICRRRIVRGLIQAFRDSPRRPFPGWNGQSRYIGSFSMADTA
jgi:hypothetical protein